MQVYEMKKNFHFDHPQGKKEQLFAVTNIYLRH
jgi:hypothetical protein